MAQKIKISFKIEEQGPPVKNVVPGTSSVSTLSVEVDTGSQVVPALVAAITPFVTAAAADAAAKQQALDALNA